MNETPPCIYTTFCLSVVCCWAPGGSMVWLSLPQQIWLVHEFLFHVAFDDLRVNVCKDLDLLDILWMKTLYWLHSGWTQPHSYSGIWLFLPHLHPLLLGPSSTCVASCLLEDSHSDWSKPEFQFHSAFPSWLKVEHFKNVFICYSIYFFIQKGAIQFICLLKWSKIASWSQGKEHTCPWWQGESTDNRLWVFLNKPCLFPPWM